MRLLFVHIWYIFSYFYVCWAWTFYPPKMFRGCLVCVICISNSFHSLIINFVLWLFTHWTCTPYILCTLDIYFWGLNLDITLSTPPTVNYIVWYLLSPVYLNFAHWLFIHWRCALVTQVKSRVRGSRLYWYFASLSTFFPVMSWRFPLHLCWTST